MSTAIQVCQSPTNKSKTKQMYSFARADRFANVAKSWCGKFCYDQPTTLGTRGAGIGYGDRNNLARKEHSPSPDAYNKPTEFDKTNKKNVFTFGVSRDAYTKVYLEGTQPRDETVPGPGTYNVRKEPGNEGPKYTLRPLTSHMNEKKARQSPGPGNYEVKPTIDVNGNYFNSKYKSSGAKHFDPPTSQRFKDPAQGRISPGPGSYNPKTNLAQTGEYFISKFRSSACRTFYHSDRHTTTIDASNTIVETPGPGTYRAPSEFGHYDSTKFSTLSSHKGSIHQTAGTSSLRSERNNSNSNLRSSYSKNSETGSPTKRSATQTSRATPLKLEDTSTNKRAADNKSTLKNIDKIEITEKDITLETE